MGIYDSWVFQLLSDYAYQPGTVYTVMVAMMLLSSVGLPIPEELTLISVGIIAFMGANQDIFPPPYVGAPVVEVHTAAWIAFFAVFGSDSLIYFIGRFYGSRLITHPRTKRFFPESAMAKIREWTQKYGVYAVGIFRFTPGIRFPGHLASGMLHYPYWKFALVDCLAAGISVPTQIYLLAHYGEPILVKIHEFKIIVGSVIGFILLWVLARWIYRKIKQPVSPNHSL